MRPNDSLENCPGEPCLSFHQYIIEQTTKFFTNRSTFIFLPGNHTLLPAAYLPSVSNITLKGESDVTILIGTEFYCDHVANLTIFGLKFLFAFDDDTTDHEETYSFALVFSQSMDIVINNTTFEGSADVRKTALQLMYSIVSISDCLFESNAADNNGAIFALDSAVILNGSTFTGNRADAIDGYGGAIVAIADSTITLHGNTFTGNRANGQGGAIYSQASTLVMNGDLFEGNEALVSGGAISADNSAVDINGVLYPTNYTSDGQSTADVVYFYNNTANNGGAIHAIACTFTFSGNAVIFSGNSAFIGGALLSLGSSVIVGAHHVCFCGNTARGEGGGIYLEGGSFSINDSSFTEFTSNSASVGGGMFSFDAQVSVDAVEKLAYLGNRAMEFGGAISIYPEQAQVTISASFVNKKMWRGW